MSDLVYLAILIGCVAATWGLVRLCATLMPRDTSGSNP
jgi:hypothetical protein